ncbi:hypothetical protein WJU16_00820 [Chitinophaga pollutisoli]|uniref:Uncharacterized protein n=1 Tax=Chitinophaga pollutisoli TaxID=3133966 RepID=A0ABZ2YQ59_9BACT
MLQFRMIRIFLIALLTILLGQPVIASEEPYQIRLTGRIKAGDTLLLRDEKFQNPGYNWELINNHKVSNLIVFALNADSVIDIKKPFTGKIRLKVEYWSQPGQIEPLVEDEVSLEVKYDTATGLAYKEQDVFRFLNGHKVKITINSIESAELGESIPGVFTLTSMVIVDRSYMTDPTAPPVAMFANEDENAASTLPAFSQVPMSIWRRTDVRNGAAQDCVELDGRSREAIRSGMDIY